MRKGGRDRAKKRHTHISVVVKKSRHRLPTPESNMESSDSEDTSSCDSDSEWSGERRTGDKNKSRVESSEDSVKRERGRRSLRETPEGEGNTCNVRKRLKNNLSFLV